MPFLTREVADTALTSACLFSTVQKLRLTSSRPQIGVVSGKAIFAQPLDEYWKKKLQEEPAAKENDSSTS
ncbi:hypothetical protein RDI58_006001 [Solanum bulbocastanum]|uniref:Uncharacterized protein n=1 Tax=Solanum bulbocastanum TaxID=147425 RepID=A0AAN8U4Z1_SOLBU